MKKIKVLIITEFVLLALFIGIIVVNQHQEQNRIYAQHSKLSVEERVTLIPADKLPEQTVTIEPITTNLKDGRFVVVGLSVLTDHSETAIELQGRIFQLNDFLIKKITNSTKQDVQSKESMNMILNEAKNYMNEELNNGEILKIYVTEKMIQ